MANSLEVVRITYSDLLQIDEELKMETESKGNSNSQQEKKKRREAKRPSRAIYQPGVSRLSRNKQLKSNGEISKEPVIEKESSVTKTKHQTHTTNEKFQNHTPVKSQGYQLPTRHQTMPHKIPAPHKPFNTDYTEEYTKEERSRHSKEENNPRERDKLVTADEGGNIMVFSQIFTPSVKHSRGGAREQDGTPQFMFDNEQNQLTQVGPHHEKPPPLMQGFTEKKDLKPFGRGRDRDDQHKHIKIHQPNIQYPSTVISDNESKLKILRQIESGDEGLTITVGRGGQKSNQRQVIPHRKVETHHGSWEDKGYSRTINSPVADNTVQRPMIQSHQVVPVPSENWPAETRTSGVKIMSENWDEANDREKLDTVYQNSEQQFFVEKTSATIVKVESENISHTLKKDRETDFGSEGHSKRGQKRKKYRLIPSGNKQNGPRIQRPGRSRQEWLMPGGDGQLSSKDIQGVPQLFVTVNKDVRGVRNLSNISRSRSSSESEPERKPKYKERHSSGKSQHEHGHKNEQDQLHKDVESDSVKVKRGGIIKLAGDSVNFVGMPSKASPPLAGSPGSSQYNAYFPHAEPRPQRQRDQRQQGQTLRPKRGDQSRLWDPSRPNEKPAIPPKQVQQQEELQFYDTDEDNQYEYYSDKASLEQYPSKYSAYNPAQVSGSWADQVDVTYPESTQQYYPRMAHPSPEYLQQTKAMESVHRDSAQRLLRDAERYRGDLRNIIERRLNTKERILKAFETRSDLEQQYEGVILLDLNLCHDNNVEQILWKYSYHHVIEALRKELQDEDQDDVTMLKTCLLQLLEHGASFYEGLITKLQTSYGFNLQHHTTCLDPLHSEKTRKIKLCLLSAQRCMIALGDIARYKEQVNDTSNYGRARSWYLKAQQLAPRNGRPYNQLALLALNTRRKLDAVYYYIRSLEASNPFESAKESLKTLFEEVRRKVAFSEQTKIEAAKKKMSQRCHRSKEQNNDLSGRREIWISYDGQRIEEKKQQEEDENDELSKLSPVDLNKRFVLSFLNVHGKLFTKIGMETFGLAVEVLLKEFAALIHHSPPPVNSTRLLQLMAINMFSVNHTGYKDAKDLYHYGRPALQEQAIQVGLDMFALLLHSSTQFVKDHLVSPAYHDGITLNEDLRELLPGVKVWADWMMSHVLLWEQPLLNPTRYSATKDVWEEIANLLNTIIVIDSSCTHFSLQKQEGWQEVVLPEDAAMAGFVPLQTIPLQPFYVPTGQDKIPAMDKVRVNALVTWGNIMEGQERPLVAYSAAHKQYYSCFPTNHPLIPNNTMQNHDIVVEKDVIVEEDVYEEVETGGDGNIKMLKEHKEQLQRKIDEQNRKEREIQAIVESHRTQRQLVLEISPTYLVPDTNCFIDHLQDVQSLVESKRYTLVVPLVVINELDGLSRGVREEQFSNSGHSMMVGRSSMAAVQYLEDQFETRNRHVRALTAQGTVLDSISFRHEEASNKGNNDDLILNCCVYYCTDKARDFMPKDKDAPICLRRDVVLLTDDRNLRVKALNRNVPVKDIVTFIKWAKVKK